MDSVFDGLLCRRNPRKFEQIRRAAESFSGLYAGHNIIRDDIFIITENYARLNGMPLEWFRFPIEDKELRAYTFVRGGRIFAVLNTALALSEQIFAAAHEIFDPGHPDTFGEPVKYNSKTDKTLEFGCEI